MVTKHTDTLSIWNKSGGIKNEKVRRGGSDLFGDFSSELGRNNLLSCLHRTRGDHQERIENLSI